MNHEESEFHRRKTSLDNNIIYWSTHQWPESKQEIARCKLLQAKLEKDIAKYEAKKLGEEE